MAGVFLKRVFSSGDTGKPGDATQIELPAALDLKSAHGPDHSGRGVLSVNPTGPCLGRAFGVHPWGLWVSQALF